MRKKKACKEYYNRKPDQRCGSRSVRSAGRSICRTHDGRRRSSSSGQDPVVCAPEDGEVLFIFDTKHAVGYAMDNGISVLIHVGIDTVKLEGKGFEILTEQGAKLKKESTRSCAWIWII